MASGEDPIASAATDERSDADGETGTVLTSMPSFLATLAITPRPVYLPCESSVERIDSLLTPSFSLAYLTVAALSATDTEMNCAALGALLSTGVNGMPPIAASLACCQTWNAPGAPVSAPPRIAVGCLSAIWPAQRPEVAGWPSVAHETIFTGRPAMPPL